MTILRPGTQAPAPMWRDYLDAELGTCLIEWIRVVGPVANHALGQGIYTS